MGFAQEMKDFAEGFETGQKFWQRREDAKRTRAAFENERLPTEEEINEQPGITPQTSSDTPGGGGTPKPVKVNADTGKVASRLKGDLMRDFKLSDAQASGIVGSLAAESGGFKQLQELNPTVKGSRGGYGYAQWTGPRRRQFEEYARANKLDPTSYEANYGFLKTELGGPEGRVLDDVRSAKDAASAATAFTGSAASGRGFLRPGIVNMASRHNWANQFASLDPGSQVMGIATPEQIATAKPVGRAPDEGPDKPAIPEPGDIDKNAYASAGRSSPEGGIQIAAVDLPEIGVPQVATEFTLDTGALSPPRDQEARPVMWAAEGGVIPEFADGGSVNPAGTPDKYNPARAWTQQPTGPAPSTFVPRRVGMPAPGASTGGGGGMGISPSQQAFRDLRAKQAAAAAAPAAAPAQQTGDWQQVMRNQQAAAALQKRMQPTNLGGHLGHTRQAPGYIKQQQQDYARAVAQATRDARAAGQDPWLAQQMVDPTKYARKLPGRGFEEGGVIPEPGESYARGGKVKDRDARFQEYLRQERTVTQHGEGSQGARDRAAKRLSAAEGRPTSSAYRPSQDTEYFKPRKARPKTGGKPRGGGDRKTYPEGGKTGGSPNVQEDRETRFRQHEVDDLNEDRATRFRAPQAGLSRNPYETERGGGVASPVAAEMADRDRARADRSMGPSPVAAELADRDRNRGAIPEPGATDLPALPDARGPVVKGDRVITPGIVRPENDVTFEGGIPAAWKVIKPYFELDPETGQPARLGLPDVSDLGKPIGELGPSSAGEVFVDPQRFAPDVAPPEQGAWVNGRWIPASAMTTPGMGAAFAEGGLVDDEEDTAIPMSPRAESAGYTTSAPGRPGASRAPAPASPGPEPAAEPQKADVQATPKLLSDVGNAVKGGARFLSRHFGLDQSATGGIPTPESGAAREDGIRRFASGEGAATPEEIQGIDDKVDPDRELAEGDRHMVRMAKITQWYLSRGRKDEAEASAAGLLQYGAQRFGQLGSLASAALKNGDTESAAAYLKKAYEFIPDGGGMDIEIDPGSGAITATHKNADGQEQTINVSPEQLPGLVQQAMNGSAYWKQIFRLGDPTSAAREENQAFEKSEEIRRHGRDRGEELEDRTYEEGQKTAEEQREEERKIREEERETKRKIDEEKRGVTTKIDEEKRLEEREKRQKLLDESLQRTRPAKPGDTPVVDQDALSSALEKADAAQAAWAESTSDEALKAARDQALSELYDASGQDEKLMTDLGYDKASFKYTRTQQPPMAGAVRRKDKDGNPIWAIQKDGKWYQVG